MLGKIFIWKVTINVNLPQSLCFVVLLPENGEFRRFWRFCFRRLPERYIERWGQLPGKIPRARPVRTVNSGFAYSRFAEHRCSFDLPFLFVTAICIWIYLLQSRQHRTSRVYRSNWSGISKEADLISYWLRRTKSVFVVSVFGHALLTSPQGS